jgi:hypothetical protein
MNSDFRAQAAALRNAAADPKTDLQLIRLMMETAADLEAASEAIDTKQNVISLSETFTA